MTVSIFVIVAAAAVVLFLAAQLAGLIVLTVHAARYKKRKNAGISLPPK